MTHYGYIIMTIVDICMIWLHFDCIMQLKKSYHIATNVCSRKSATTFGDLPDCKPFIQTQVKENIKAPRHWPCIEPCYRKHTSVLWVNINTASADEPFCV